MNISGIFVGYIVCKMSWLHRESLKDSGRALVAT